MESEQERKLREELERVKDLIRLRCGYILGQCNSEREMRSEAQGLIDAVEEMDERDSQA